MREKIKTRSDARIDVTHDSFTLKSGEIMECDEINVGLPDGRTIKIETHTTPSNGTWVHVWLHEVNGDLAGSVYAGACGYEITDDRKER